MILYSKKTELLALFVLTRGDKDSTRLISRVEATHFFLPATQSSYNRFMYVLRTKGNLTNWYSLCEDLAIEESHRDLLKSFETANIIYDVDVLVSTLENYRLGRALNNISNYVLDKLNTSVDSEILYEDVLDRMTKARVVTEDQVLYHMGQGNNTTSIVKRILDQDNKPPVVPTGFATYDRIMGGFPDHGLVVLAATTSSGKSAMANQLCLNMHKIGWDVCKVSLEMSEEQEIERMLSSITGIEHKRIRSKKLRVDEIKVIRNAYKKFVIDSKQAEKRLTVVSPIEDVGLTQLLILLKPYDYKVIIIDYISLLKEKEGVEQWKSLSDAAREAKRFTLKQKCLVIMLAQLDDDNRIRYSKAIKEHCVTGDTYVNINGKLQIISEVWNNSTGKVISTLDGEDVISKGYKFNLKNVKNFTTSYGFHVGVSTTTPMLVNRNGQLSWIKSGKVKIGDKLVIRNSQKFIENFKGTYQELDSHVVRLLAYLSLPPAIFVTVSTKIATDYHFCWKYCFPNEPMQYWNADSHVQQLPKILNELGLNSVAQVPTCILTSSKINAMEYIRTFLMCYSEETLTKRFATEFQLLLLKLNIIGKVLQVETGYMLDSITSATEENFLDEVTSIVDTKETVYDFTVPVSEKDDNPFNAEGNFVANGIVVHNSDVVWTWALTEADRENNKFTVNQVKGRNLGLISFEVNADFECMRLTDGGNFVDEEYDAPEVSDLSDLTMG